jgi:hypothetical protein
MVFKNAIFLHTPSLMTSSGLIESDTSRLLPGRPDLSPLVSEKEWQENGNGPKYKPEPFPQREVDS